MAIRRALLLIPILAACGTEDPLFEVDDSTVALRVVDALTREPIADARLRTFDGESLPEGDTPIFEELSSDTGGRAVLTVLDATHLAVERAGYFAELVRIPRINEDDRSERVAVDVALFPAREPTEEELAIFGPRGTGAGAPDEGPLSLEDPGVPGGLSIGGNFRLPARIRVGRTFTTSGGSCPPVRAVEEMSLESYVKGVVTSEIGVFRWTSGGDNAAADAYKTMAVAARSYAIYFYLLNPNGNFTVTLNGRTVRYHINDTACHQRYDDPRHAPISAAVDATRGQILVNANRTSIDKYEYAASCGRHGTRPEHRIALVADRPGLTACVGSWCGHNTCAGHEGCVVRGICQWGTLERSKRGDTYAQIIAHYQPELVRVDFDAPATPPPPPPPPPNPNPNPTPNPNPPADTITVDNTTSGRFRASTRWDTSTWASGKIGANYRYRAAESVSDAAEYKLDIPTAGRWEVFARVPGDGYNTDTPYIIRHRGGSTTVHRNISGRGGEWMSLGAYDFDRKDDWIVSVSCWTSGTGWIIADAIRAERRP